MISKKLLILLGFTIFFSLAILSLSLPTTHSSSGPGMPIGAVFGLIFYMISFYGLVGCILIWIAIGLGKLIRKLNKRYSFKTSVAITTMIVFTASFSIYSYISTCGFFPSAQSPDFCMYFS